MTLADHLASAREAVADLDGQPVDDPGDPVVFLVDSTKPGMIEAVRLSRWLSTMESRGWDWAELDE